MSQAYYPKLDLGALAAFTTIRQQASQFEDYFDSDACIYDKNTKAELKSLFAPNIVEKTIEVERIVERKVEVAMKAAEGGKTGPKVKLKTSGVDMDGVSAEIQDLRKELQQLKVDGKTLQTADKIQIIKTRAALVERLVSMDEKVNTQKRLSLFQSVVMGILDDLIPSDRRLEFIKRVTPFAVEEA